METIMNYFSTEINQIGKDALSIRELASSLQNFTPRIERIASSLSLSGTYSLQVKRRLRDLSGQVAAEAVNLRDMGSVLQEIAQAYEKTERAIVQNASIGAKGNSAVSGGMTKAERDAYKKYKREVDELLEILSGKRGMKECVQKWYELLQKASIIKPGNCTLTKAEKEAILRFLAPMLDGTADGYNKLISEVPWIGTLIGNYERIANSRPGGAVEEGFYKFFSIGGALQTILGFTYNPDTDSYYTKEGSLQNQWGFNDAMDQWGPTLGMDLDTSISTFTYDGQEFRVQFWKGTYGWDGAVGGEFGLYSRPEWEAKGNPYVEGSPESRMILYEAVDQKYQVPVRQTTTYTRDSGRSLRFVNDTGAYGDGDHYWNLNIRTEAGIEKQTVRSEYVIDCSKQGSGFCDAMYQSLSEKPELQVSRNGDVITVKY